jgi:hypothetical protein
MARQHGSKGSVEADLAGADTPVPIIGLNNWTLSAKRDRADVTAFGDPNKVWVQGLPDVSGALGGWWDSETEILPLFAAAMGDIAVSLKLIPTTLEEDIFFSGKAWIDAGINVGSNGGVSISGSWAASGPWVMPTAPVIP